MKILSVTNCPLDPTLGSGKTASCFSRGLGSLGHSVRILEPSDYVLFPQMQRASKIRHCLGAFSAVVKAMSRDTYDIIEAYGDEFGLCLWYAKRRTRLRVYHTNGLEPLAAELAPDSSAASKGPVARVLHKARSVSHRWFTSLTLTNSEAFVALSEADRRYVVERDLYSLARTAVVPPGLDAEYLGAVPQVERRHNVVFVGTWIARKGVDVLAEIMVPLLLSDRSLVLEIYGSGLPAPQVLSAFPSSVVKQVTVHGRLPRSAITSALTRAKVFLFPSRYEGFGLALAEAMACGCAAVTTPTGLGAELATSEAMVFDFNDVERMQEGVRTLLDDEKLRRRVGEAGRAKARSFEWEKASLELARAYETWLEQSPECSAPLPSRSRGVGVRTAPQ